MTIDRLGHLIYIRRVHTRSEFESDILPLFFLSNDSIVSLLGWCESADGCLNIGSTRPSHSPLNSIRMSPQHPLIDNPAPSFSTPDSNGEIFKFPPEKDGKRIEKPIALFFYPESGQPCSMPTFFHALNLTRFRYTGTYGCTREACHFRDAVAGVCRLMSRIRHVLITVR